MNAPPAIDRAPSDSIAAQPGHGTLRRVWDVVRHVIVRTVDGNGFTYAGNLAYLSLVALFPFFIVAAAVARLIGQNDIDGHALTAFLMTVPPNVADVLRGPITDVLSARTGPLLWAGALVGLWTTASLIETVRGVFRAAYGVKMQRPFYHYRLRSIAFMLGATLLTVTAFTAQLALTGAASFLSNVLPLSEALDTIQRTRLLPSIALFAGLAMLFYAVTPSGYRRGSPTWPGALFVAGWWLGTTALLPRILGLLADYDRTYGSLAGVMITLIFFYVIGLGLVMGAHLNAALAKRRPGALEHPDDE